MSLIGLHETRENGFQLFGILICILWLLFQFLLLLFLRTMAGVSEEKSWLLIFDFIK